MNARYILWDLSIVVAIVTDFGSDSRCKVDTLCSILTRNQIETVCLFLIIKSLSRIFYNEEIFVYAVKSRAISNDNTELVSNIL
jgi:hypothetical protein